MRERKERRGRYIDVIAQDFSSFFDILSVVQDRSEYIKEVHCIFTQYIFYEQTQWRRRRDNGTHHPNSRYK